VGRFTLPLAEHFVTSCGVDRSDIALQTANGNSKNSPRPVIWIRSEIEATNFVASLFDFALISMVLEHVKSRAAVISELSRIVSSEGKVLIRTMLPADVRDTSWYRFFPEAEAIELARTPTVEELSTLALQNGFRVTDAKSFRDSNDSANSEEFLARIRDRSYESLGRISDAAFSGGMARLEASISGQTTAEIRCASLVVLER
jgi:ubiquinone/menaquinone biosynthesis C-methylase UbiE